MGSTNQMALESAAQIKPVETVEPGLNQVSNDGVGFYHRRMLDELPGAAFAAVTLFWIISSFGHLTL